MTVEGANETLLRALRQREQVETQALAECDPDTSEALLDDTLSELRQDLDVMAL